MARLHEYQGKELLKRFGLAVPRGVAASTPAQARDGAKAIDGHVVVKIQAWTTGRAAIGGIAFAQTPDEAAAHATRMLAMRVGQFPVTHVLVEERLSLAGEVFLSLSIDDRARQPVLLLAKGGGTGIEERASSVVRIPCHVHRGPDRELLRRAAEGLSTSPLTRGAIVAACERVFELARSMDARSVEINPLGILADGTVVAADCRVTIDDYAVFRHPELNIEIARELDHPPTDLEKRAYRVEQEDHRGTFFFAQMNAEAAKGSKGLIGFHGAGGGGSMMSMDAITGEGFTIANFCDTSGNPSAAKVYRAARIILEQPGLVGYFGSGSGVANQEQFWSAYGLAKAFLDLQLSIPAVIRLGGNTEDRAVDILQSACRSLPVPVEGYKKNDPPARIAARFATLVAEHQAKGKGAWTPREITRPAFASGDRGASFALSSGRVWIDRGAWASRAGAIVARANGLLKDQGGAPALAVAPEVFAAKDADMIACEIECRRDGIGGVFVELDMPTLGATSLPREGREAVASR